ncbi:ATP-dependent RNA helicase [Colletotrichum tofieldiae]|nr:ATP-dependent RNA helicase [Colletotrichum tofieldiae]
MPRPKRARRAPPAPVAVAVAPEEKSSPAPASGSDIYSHSDREHSVIRKELEKEDKGGPSRLTGGASARLSRSSSLRQRQALKKSAHARDEAMSRLEDELDTTSPKAKTSSDQRQKSDSSVELELSRKTRATPVQHRRDTTGLDLDDDMFEGLDTTIGDDDDDAAAPPSAPRSDTSTFSVSHFRRRGRAPSISINKDDAPIRPSSRGVGSTPGISSKFNIGLFKRRQREPSILGTAQKERAQRPIELSSGPDTDDEVGDGFEPEAESTPLQNRRKTQPPPATEPESESQQVLAPDSQPIQKEAGLASSTRSRKRKSIEGHEEAGRPGKASRTEPEPEIALARSHAHAAFRVPSPTTPNRDEIMAPPESSDGEDSEEAWPDIRTLAKQRRRRASPVTPTRDGNVSDASSPPSLTHSPNFPATRNKSRQKKQAKPPKVTTADLTGLLPRRRHKKARDPYSMNDTEEEIDASNLAEHDDELSYIDARTRSRRAKITPLNRSTANRPASRSGKAAASADKSRAVTRSATRTYSRRLSDKENEGEDAAEAEAEVEAEAEAEADDGPEGDSFAPIQDDVFESQESSDPIRSADELKKAARKFQEVDRWELEFEEVTEDSSPNRDAR